MHQRVSQHRSHRPKNSSIPEPTTINSEYVTRRMISPLRDDFSSVSLSSSLVTVLGSPLALQSIPEEPVFSTLTHATNGLEAMQSDLPEVMQETDTMIAGIVTSTLAQVFPSTSILEPPSYTQSSIDTTPPVGIPFVSTSLSSVPNMGKLSGAHKSTSPAVAADTSTLSMSLTWTSMAIPAPDPPISSESSSVMLASLPTISDMVSPHSDQTAQSTYTDYGTSTCKNNPSCAAVEDEDESRRGMITGIIVGVVAAAILLFAAYRFWRWKRKRASGKAESGKHSVWHKISHSDGSSSVRNTLDLAKQQRGFSKVGKMEAALGEPGPAFAFDDAYADNNRSSNLNHLSPWNRTLSGSAFSGDSSDRFRHPVRQNIENEPPGSIIGLALTRYSTCESHEPTDKPRSSAKSDSAPTSAEESIADSNERYSSISGRSDGTIGIDHDVVYVGKARTARRHSLTPRVIDIVAADDGNAAIDLENDHSHSLSSNQDALKRASIRSRSLSPAKLLSSHTNRQTSLTNGVLYPLNGEVAGDKNGAIPSVLRAGKSPTKVGGTPALVGPVIPERGRSMKRTPEQVIHQSPASYPKLGKTMFEVKKTIREKRNSAFASSDHLYQASKTQKLARPRAGLPKSVTVERGSARR